MILHVSTRQSSLIVPVEKHARVGNLAISFLLVSISSIACHKVPRVGHGCGIPLLLQPLKNFRALRKWAEMPTRGGKSEQIARWAEIGQIAKNTARQDFKHDPQYGDNVNNVMTLRRQPISIF
jgi:hypothetical protein